MIRVNHSGERGAIYIYKGQKKSLSPGPIRDVIEHMENQEKAHLKYFEEKLSEDRIRPSILTPLWDWGAYTMGRITGLMGPEAAMACTQAVEEVIDQHYEEQIETLKTSFSQEQDLIHSIEKFQKEEQEHRDLAIDHGSLQAPSYKILTFVIKKISKGAIFLSKRF
jgi:ubiquinone biosynthesis monooxygenase Coq7